MCGVELRRHVHVRTPNADGRACVAPNLRGVSDRPAGDRPFGHLKSEERRAAGEGARVETGEGGIRLATTLLSSVTSGDI